MQVESFADQDDSELVDSINATATKMDAVVRELESVAKKLAKLGAPYESQAKQAGVFAESISSYADVMRDFWPYIWKTAEVDQ